MPMKYCYQRNVLKIHTHKYWTNCHLIVSLHHYLYRCAHTYSESIRLQFPSAGLQNSLNQYSNELGQNKMKGKEEMKRITEIVRKLLIIVGPLGTGVRTIGGLITKRLSAHEMMSHHTLGCIEINLADILPETSLHGSDYNSGFLKGFENLTTTAIAPLNENSRFSSSSIIVVILTTVAECCIPQADLLKLLTANIIRNSQGISVSLVGTVAIVSAKSILCDAIGSAEW